MKRITRLITSTLITFIYFISQPAQAEIQRFNIRNTNNFDNLLTSCSNYLIRNEAIIIYSKERIKKSSKEKYENEIIQIIIGNEKIGKKAIEKYNPTATAGSSTTPVRKLHFHHVIFKDMRESLPGIPYLCFQVPVRHHKSYHKNIKNLYIKYENFSTIANHLDKFKQHMRQVSNDEKDNYSHICATAATISLELQKKHIGDAYSWLNLTSSSKYLMIAHRLIAPNTFPNTIIANKSLCTNYQSIIEEERNLCEYIRRRIQNDNALNDQARHLRKILEGKIEGLDVYTRENKKKNISTQEAIEKANKKHGKCEKLYRVRLKISNINETDSDQDSVASSIKE